MKGRPRYPPRCGPFPLPSSSQPNHPESPRPAKCPMHRPARSPPTRRPSATTLCGSNTCNLATPNQKLTANSHPTAFRINNLQQKSSESIPYPPNPETSNPIKSIIYPRRYALHHSVGHSPQNYNKRYNATLHAPHHLPANTRSRPGTMTISALNSRTIY